MPFTLREEILKSLRASPVILRQLVHQIDDAMGRYQPAPDEWSIIEVVAHMVDVDERALERVERMLHEEHPDLLAFDPEELARDRRYHTMDLAEQLARHNTVRQAHVARLTALDDRAWTRTGRHSVHGAVTIELYEAHVASEDIDHLAQIARLLAAR